MRAGRHIDWLGSEALSWRDLHVIVRFLPADSALYRDMNPETWEWGVAEQLLRHVANFTAREEVIKYPGADEADQPVTGKGGVPMSDFEKAWNGGRYGR